MTKLTKTEQFLFDEIRTRFDKWNKTNYSDRTIQGDKLAWRAWCAALLNEREEMEARCRKQGWYQETVPDYQMVTDVQVFRKILEIE